MLEPWRHEVDSAPIADALLLRWARDLRVSTKGSNGAMSSFQTNSAGYEIRRDGVPCT